jgi:hypothetical protein
MSQQRFSWIWIGTAAFVAGISQWKAYIDGKWKFIIVSTFNTNSLDIAGKATQNNSRPEPYYKL